MEPTINCILIYGLGREGASTRAFFAQHHPDVTVHVHDDGQGIVATEDQFAQAAYIFLSPGIAPEKVPAPHRAKITNQWSFVPHITTQKQRDKIMGITGTKGKTTTATLLVDVLRASGQRAAVGGNIGVPIFDVIDQIDALDWLVCELSSYQLEHAAWSPRTALCTNLYADHLDRHGTVAQYHAAKSNLWRHQSAAGDLFVPEHQRGLFSSWNQAQACPPIAEDLIRHGVFSALHWRQNFGLLVPFLAELGIETQTLCDRINQFAGVDHRMKTIATMGKIQFVDDAIAVNPASTLAAVRHYKTTLRALVLGGQDRGVSCAELFDALPSECPDVTLLLLGGDLQSAFADAAQTRQIAYQTCETMHDVVAAALRVCDAGVVLLSPAAPSFDRFKDYAAKGNAFAQAVQDCQSA